MYSPRGDPISSQAPTSQSGGESMAQAAAENGDSTFPADPPRRTEKASRIPCSFDWHTRRYTVCLQVSNDGRCTTYGAPCTPGEQAPRASVQSIR